MSTPSEELYHAINGVEPYLLRLDGLTQILFGIGEGPSKIEPEAVSALAHAFSDVVTQIERNWKAANLLAAAARGIPT